MKGDDDDFIQYRMRTSCKWLRHANRWHDGAASVALRRPGGGPDSQTEAPIHGICGGMPSGTPESLALASCMLDITCCSLVIGLAVCCWPRPGAESNGRAS
eukprot:6213416-Pleurochrysis_carterae.AAC.9